MCAKRCKLALPTSSHQIRKTRKALREMSKASRIDLMVKAGAMNQRQADTAKRKLAEVGDDSEQPATCP